MEQVLQTQGSLELFINRNGFLKVRFADWYEKSGEASLKSARMWHAIGDHQLNGSQAVTVKGWHEARLAGAFDKALDYHDKAYAGKEVFC